MTKSKISIYNAVASLLQMMVTSVLGLVLGKSILNVYGSDYNGVNSTITQIVSTLMVFEGGFTLASNVALFEPFAKKNYEKVNGILSATRRRFISAGMITCTLGVLLAAIYPFTISSAMPKWMICALMLTVMLPTCVNLGTNMKYRVLILTAQKEYVISLFSTLTYIVGNITAIILIHCGYSILVARVAIMLSMLAGYALIAAYCRHCFSFVRFKVKPLFDEIKGTKNVIMLKVMSVCYSSVPIVVISTMPGEGTLLASVYAVYKSIVYMIKNALTALCNAPRLSFGILFAEGNENKARDYFEKYELVTCIGISVVLGATCLLLFPFVELYTMGVTDVDYKNIPLAVIMLLTALVEIIHIPSGQMIQMKGDFVVSQKIQTIACIVLLVSMVIGRIFGGVVGIAFSVLLAAIILAIFEVTHTAKNIFHRKLTGFLKNVLPCAVILCLSTLCGMSGWIKCENYLEFIMYGIISVVALGAITFFCYFCVRRTEILEILSLLVKVLFQRKNKG